MIVPILMLIYFYDRSSKTYQSYLQYATTLYAESNQVVRILIIDYGWRRWENSFRRRLISYLRVFYYLIPKMAA
jgi:hypothetical protein